MATISTHLGSTVSQKHNRRDRSVTDKEEHIDKNGTYKVYRDIPLKQAYEDAFGQSVLDYNATQKRADRKIENYLDKINQDKRKNAVYEMIVGVYDKEVDEKTKRQICVDFINQFQKQNPNMKIIGVYYHADEPQAEPHWHIDLIPLGHFDKGMKVRNSLSKALEEQGYIKEGSIHETPQIRWERDTNALLENICNRYGVEVEHPMNKREHLETEVLKLQTQVNRLEKQCNVLQQRIEEQEEQLARLNFTNSVAKNEEIVKQIKENVDEFFEQQPDALARQKEQVHTENTFDLEV